MRWGFAIAFAVLAASCHGNHQGGSDAGRCSPSCSGGLVCRYDTCVAPPAMCAANAGCPGDDYCDVGAMECLPWGVGPGGDSDPRCQVDPVPEVFFPGVQCEWVGPPAGDRFPDHVNVLATPMVATFDAHGTPSIVFTTYNATDHTSVSCTGGDPASFGVIRVIDGRTCAQQATISTPMLIASAPVAIADLGGADATPEIVAARSDGGLVAFTRTPAGWVVLWQVAVPLVAGRCDLAGPSIHDLDDDGLPEVIYYGAVFNGQTGARIDDTADDDTIVRGIDSIGLGYIPVVTDVDGDGVPELVTGAQLYSWDKANRHWAMKHAVDGMNGLVAVGDFGTFPTVGQDDRSHTDGVAEIVVVYLGIVHVFTVTGREVFTATLQGIKGGAGQGGPPVIADFDGDGRLEIGVAGATAYHVLDPDCGGVPDPATCASRSTNGILWMQPSQGDLSDLPGSSAFDFDGDGRAEVVYGDQCFTRVYDGATGKVLASSARTSCTWYENPVVADTDGDSHAELVTTSNRNCGITCPAVDPIFDGVSCFDDSDCTGALRCGRDEPGEALGRCRCAKDAECGDGFVCRDPIAGPAPAGKVCRASHPATSGTGVRVLADTVDRWGSARAIWNQHAYSVTNIDPAGKVPRTSQWLRNWTQVGLNNFRENAPGGSAHARPDLTVKQAKVTCDASVPTVSAEVCNRGGEAVAPGLPVAVYTSTTPSRLRCQAQTAEPLAPGACTTVSCTWPGAPGDGAVVVDDNGDGNGVARECREDNNAMPIHVSCP